MRHGRLGLLAALVLTAAVMPSAAATDSPPKPYLWVYDAPFTRNKTVSLAFVHGDYDVVGKRLASNSPTLNEQGLLAEGVEVAPAGDWMLADGADGPRTIYGQVLYKDGKRTGVMSLPMHLDTTGPSSLYVDLDPQGGPYTIKTPTGNWRERLSSRDHRFTAHAIPASDGTAGPVGFQALAGQWGSWGVYFARSSGGAPTAGTYQVNSTSGDFNVGVQGRYGSSCSGTGTFTIHAIEFHGDGDLKMVDADFKLLCRDKLMAGSVQYGLEREIQAVSQSAEQLSFPSTKIGQQSESLSVTFTNFGDLPAPMGAAALSGVAAADYAITANSCTDTTLAVGKACSISIRFAPSERGMRGARLTAADPTVRGARSVRLLGAGFQETALDLAASLPTTGEEVTFVVTITPPTEDHHPSLFIDGEQQPGPTVTELTDPARRAYSYTVDVTPGEHVATAHFLGGDLFLPSEAEPVAFTITDTSGPMVTLGSPAIVAGTSVDSSKLVVRIVWAGTDPSGVAHYQVQRRVGTNDWMTVSSSTTATQLQLALRAGRTHAFRVRGVDNAGNVSGWAESPAMRLRGIQERSARISYAKSWTLASSTAYWRGGARYARAADAKATITFAGRSIAWVARTGPKRGQTRIVVDGAHVATVELYSAKARSRRVVWAASWDTFAWRQITISVRGTSGRPRVDLDAFATID